MRQRNWHTQVPREVYSKILLHAQSEVYRSPSGPWDFVLAAAQVWVFRYQATTDSISYLDMSDGVLPDSDWHRLINGVWSPLYPLLLGMVRRILPIPARIEIVAAHWMNLGFFLFAFLCFEFLLGGMFPKLETIVSEAVRRPGFLAGHIWWLRIPCFCGLTC